MDHIGLFCFNMVLSYLTFDWSVRAQMRRIEIQEQAAPTELIMLG